ncbi:hypothetical protein [Desulfofalx alkaliphila]|uniref:hypothetical protein n=1 Tax=Desulfofalx alkaliphila TaxID=105483 RepID=UPI0004E17A34|nr:hypothetical protein [Desulfofalx alkaliphila]
MFVSLALVFLLVRSPGINKLWPAGLAAVAVTLMLDVTLVQLGAFRYKAPLYAMAGVPLFYIIANFANGILLKRLVPEDRLLKPLVTVGLAVVFLLVEWFFIKIGYFQHLKWSLLNSLGLNIIGFVVVLWIADLFDLRYPTKIFSL